MTTTFLDQLSGYIWLNGDLVKWQDARVHALTHSLHYAGAVFEGERSYGGRVFKIHEHTERLLASASTMQMQVPYSFDEIIAAHESIIVKNKISDAYIRPLVWRGAESLNLTNKSLSINFMIAAIASSPKPADNVSLHISRWRKPHPDSWPPQVKSSGHYAMMLVALEEAKLQGYSDAILLDWRGYIAECTTTNIFFVYKDRVITPIADSFLNGITRQTIISLAKKLGLEVQEKHISLSDIEKYDECFLTGTAAEIKLVNSIALHSLQITFADNRITSLLQQEYAALTRSEQ
ncbi:Branched-chain-amino-acid aminotransferase [Candidatus Trichorickettsia mobilis]|uniref:Branched-chain-amino-acid aminotransferase n=1 Tax=Candidatus Trichorickettsia mobilis TaxID=1346319 RepID=A0ABZ0UQ66_9RICK|nr:branched-chain amino acid transaminase [Candidatus Trichorickettsia mobilis]WPY00182.1 Branched-chain-amino-acid aminotransferase [Candidatus Trichorickettsia mobilis]